MEKRSHSLDVLFPVGLLAVFVLAAVTVILLTASVYRGTLERSAENSDGGAALSYIHEKVHQSDETGMVRAGRLGDAPALVITWQEENVYDTYIYCHDGYLRELMVKRELTPGPEMGNTIGAANTIERIIDVFPANQQRQISVQLATVLSAVVSQQLVPAVDGTMVPAFEIMTVTPAVRTMIRENKGHQIDGLLYGAARADMLSMDASLLELYRQGTITRETALTYSVNPDMLAKRL